MDLPGGGVLRDYPRLRTGGRHLGEAENAVFADVGLTALKALGVALISWLAVVGLVIATVNGSSWSKIWRGETAPTKAPTAPSSVLPGLIDGASPANWRSSGTSCKASSIAGSE